MSIEYLLEAARNQLRSNLTLPGGASKAANYIDIQPDGHPPASMGEWYVSLDEIGVNTPGIEQEYLQEVFSIAIWITKRTGKHAPDRRYSLYSEAVNGLRAIERQCIKFLHNVHAVRIAANTLGSLPGASTGDSFIQPLWYAGRGKTIYAGPEWVGKGEGDSDTFAVRQLRFVGGLRIQAPDVQA